MNEQQKAELIDLAVRILRELDYLPEAIQEFRKTGVPYYSEEPYGILWELKKDMAQIVKDIEEVRDALCYAVIKGAYRDGCGDTTRMTTYLFITKDDLAHAEENARTDRPLDDILDRYTEEYARLGYRAWALVDSGDVVETGTVCIKGRNGGLTRTM